MTIKPETLENIKTRIVSAAEVKFNIDIQRELLAENPHNDDARVLLAAWTAKTVGIVSREADREAAVAANATGPRDLDQRPQAGAPARNQFGTFKVHAASPAQLRFIQRLLGERDITKVPSLAQRMVNAANEDINSVNKKTASDLIEILMALPMLPNVAPQATNATEKQVAIVVRETARRVGFEPITEADAQRMTRREASNLIDQLFNAPFTPRPADTKLEIGIYRNDAGIFKVYPNQSKTRMLAKILVLPEGWMGLSFDERKMSSVQPEWDYRGMADRFVKAEQRMSFDEAKDFGQITSVCCCCGRMLTNELSVELGIGPVCRRGFAS